MEREEKKLKEMEGKGGGRTIQWRLGIAFIHVFYFYELFMADMDLTWARLTLRTPLLAKSSRCSGVCL